MFVQCKWLYNYILNLEGINSFDTKTRIITSLDKDRNVIERILNLPAKVIQIVYKENKAEFKRLCAIKGKGRKVGKLKFKPVRFYACT